MEKKEFACECMNYGGIGATGVLTIAENIIFKPSNLPLISPREELIFPINEIIDIEKKIGLFTGPLMNIRLKNGSVITFKTFGRDAIIGCIKEWMKCCEKAISTNGRKFCTNCGMENTESAKFCCGCGKPL